MSKGGDGRMSCQPSIWPSSLAVFIKRSTWWFRGSMDAGSYMLIEHSCNCRAKFLNESEQGLVIVFNNGFFKIRSDNLNFCLKIPICSGCSILI